MEFTEAFPITQNGSASNGQVHLSPDSKLIALSEFYAADRRIASSIEEVLPAWSVRIIESDTLCLLRDFYIKLPDNIITGTDYQNLLNSSASSAASNPKRQFITGGLTRSSVTNSSATITSPKIGPNLVLEWSPNGKFIAAWPQDTSIVYILSPQQHQNHRNSSLRHEPLLKIQELAAVGISGITWTPDSLGLFINLKYGMGIKYWRLDCKYPVHLFPYPKALEKDGIVFSADGNFLAILHRRDGVDHIAIYNQNPQNSEDWQVLKWLSVPEDVNLEGISFARGIGKSQLDQIPQLYAWESITKFQFLVYDGMGELKCHVTPEIFSDLDSNCSFGIRNWKWCASGRLAVFADTQDVLYVWNAVNQKLIGRVSLTQLEALKQQNPIVFREHQMRESTGVKYEASYTFPLQSQIVTTAVVNAGTDDLSYELSFDGEYLAVHDRFRYASCVWVFDLRAFRLKAVLIQMKPVQIFLWHPGKNVLTIAIGSENVYFWQPDGTHCIPYPEEDEENKLSVKNLKWMKNQQTILMHGNDKFCLGLPEIL